MTAAPQHHAANGHRYGRALPAYTASADRTAAARWRIWLGASTYGAAASVLFQVIPELTERRGESIIC
ncbi:hypothetical protein FOE78_08870 [Microlunatus elymi]|uniref:Uncharacterized protein n=1 Tax=Microlunatus elymi TaxID=2596828 RepID=A0A516PXU1_9ACTN|nr:hypothetical protein [Microlunatus elymi]QDP95994.1 hypothetical protein FOE78_08870 [Microlunatus elymi]